MGDCQNYGPFLGPYYNTGPNLKYPKRDHDFDNLPYRIWGVWGTENGESNGLEKVKLYQTGRFMWKLIDMGQGIPDSLALTLNNPH